MPKKSPHFSFFVRLVVAYIFPAFLLLVLLYKILIPILVGEEPKPQIPPDGYMAYEDQVTLRWSPGEHQEPFQLQVANKKDGFEKLILNRETNNTRLTLPSLPPGQTYCWRVLDDADAVVSCFKTNAAFVAY
jgi:hypothetical protein